VFSALFDDIAKTDKVTPLKGATHAQLYPNDGTIFLNKEQIPTLYITIPPRRLFRDVL